MKKAKMAQAARIARAIFECGNEPGKPTQRIQFKHGPWQHETGGGGLCEQALIGVIYSVLTAPPEPPKEGE